ncbi:molybdopterin-dependent oxidoreductase, partial [bacterium]|nr:molybdopterin-dependent oxidoreductase [bacterium]
DKIVEARYQMSPIEHASTETNGAIAVPETNDRVAVYTSTQGLFFSLGTTAKLMDISSARLHFVGGTVGGGFGGKVDTVVEPLAVLGCMLTGKPVRYVYDREEEMQVSSPRGAERWYLKDGVMNDGRIIARQFRGYFDGGAYTRLSSYAVVKGTAHLPGPYTIPNVSANVYGVYTNRTPASAMRGFGITGVDFAIECHMDRVAEAVGMDPVELRLLNSYRDGDMKAHRREAKNTALIECIQVAAEKSGWQIADKFKQMSSLVGGGGERAVIPATVTDQEGTIGSSRHSGGRAVQGASMPQHGRAGNLSSQSDGQSSGYAAGQRPGQTSPSQTPPSQTPPSQTPASAPGHQAPSYAAGQPAFSPPPSPVPMNVPTYQSSATSQASSTSSTLQASASSASSTQNNVPPASNTSNTASGTASPNGKPPAATKPAAPRSKARFSSLIGTRRR